MRARRLAFATPRSVLTATRRETSSDVEPADASISPAYYGRAFAISPYSAWPFGQPRWAGLRKAMAAQAGALGLVGVASLIGIVLVPFTDAGTVSQIFLIPVVVMAACSGLFASLTASIAGVLAYDLLFLPPALSLIIVGPGGLIRFASLLAIGLLTSQLVTRLRASRDQARATAAATNLVADLARSFNGMTRKPELAEAVATQLAAMLRAPTVVLLPVETQLTQLAAVPSRTTLSAAAWSQAESCFASGERLGATTNDEGWLFIPLKTSTSACGVLAVKCGRSPPFRDDGQCVTSAICDLAAVTLERLRRTREHRLSAEIAARDRARVALLASIGHDLRTPMSTVLGSIFEIKRRGINDPSAPVLLEDLEDETIGIYRLITNLLDIGRLETGAMPVKAEPIDLVDAVSGARDRTKRQLRARHLDCFVPVDLPLVMVDPTLLHHCLINLLDNAAKHSAPGGRIAIVAARTEDGVALSVRDDSPTARPEVIARVRDALTLPEAVDRRADGTGLGLRIVKGFVDAMGLRVTVAARSDGLPGLAVTIKIPETLVLSAQIDDECATAEVAA